MLIRNSVVYSSTVILRNIPMASKNDSKTTYMSKGETVTFGFSIGFRGEPCPYCSVVTPRNHPDDIFRELNCCDKIREKNEETKFYDAKISIKGLDKVLVLKTFWSCADQYLTFGSKEDVFDENKAKIAVTKWIGEFCNRRIYMDLSGDTVDASLTFYKTTAPAVKIIEKLMVEKK